MSWWRRTEQKSDDRTALAAQREQVVSDLDKLIDQLRTNVAAAQRVVRQTLAAPAPRRLGSGLDLEREAPR